MAMSWILCTQLLGELFSIYSPRDKCKNYPSKLYGTFDLVWVPDIRGVLCTSKNTYYLFRWNEQNSNIPMYWFKGWTLWKNSILGAMEMIFVTVNIAMCPYRMKNAIKRTGLVFILIMSESKKPGQVAVVIRYCNLSRFFLTQTLCIMTLNAT